MATPQSLQERPPSRRNTKGDQHELDHTHPSGDAEAQRLSDAHWDIRDPRAPVRFWARLKGEHKEHVPGWYESFKNIAFSTPLNVLIVFIPLAWASHYLEWNRRVTFSLCILAIASLDKISEFATDSFAHYCGKSLGDLVIITLDNVVEAGLAIILVSRCDLRLAQSTMVGVLLLHLLLVPGMAFVTGGARILHQRLDPRVTELNLSLLAIGVLTLLIPAAFFSSVSNNHATPPRTTQASVKGSLEGISRLAGELQPGSVDPISDASRDNFLSLSRGLAVILLIVYIGSRIYLHHPPGDTVSPTESAPQAPREKAVRDEEDAEMNPWSCLIVFALVVPLTVVTTQFLVASLEHIRGVSRIKQEWFGLILLPITSFSAEALVTLLHLIRKTLLMPAKPPDKVVKGRTIDLGVQYALFWMPFLVLLAWWENKPLFLLFDRFEVAIVIGTCALVNTVTGDSETNWAEGLVMVSFYVMIAVASWFYDGEQEIQVMLFCKSVASALNGENA